MRPRKVRRLLALMAFGAVLGGSGIGWAAAPDVQHIGGDGIGLHCPTTIPGGSIGGRVGQP